MINFKKLKVINVIIVKLLKQEVVSKWYLQAYRVTFLHAASAKVRIVLPLFVKRVIKSLFTVTNRRSDE